MSKQKIFQILLMATKGEDMVCQLNMNQVGRTGGIDVKAEDILDIIDGYKGGGYGVSTQHELGGQDWGSLSQSRRYFRYY